MGFLCKAALAYKKAHMTRQDDRENHSRPILITSKLVYKERPQVMTAQDDQNFYAKKERLLLRVQAGTATQAQKEWLIRWGFLEKPNPPPLKPTDDGPTRTNKIYRYRGAMKATPVAKLEGPRGSGTRKNRYGNLIAPKGKGGKRRSVFVKYQSMR